MTPTACKEYIEFLVKEMNKTDASGGMFRITHCFLSGHHYSELTHHSADGVRDWCLAKHGPEEIIFKEMVYEIGVFGVLGLREGQKSANRI